MNRHINGQHFVVVVVIVVAVAVAAVVVSVVVIAYFLNGSLYSCLNH